MDSAVRFFADRLRALRRRLGCSSVEIARRLRIRESAYLRLERGQSRTIALATFERIGRSRTTQASTSTTSSAFLP